VRAAALIVGQRLILGGLKARDQIRQFVSRRRLPLTQRYNCFHRVRRKMSLKYDNPGSFFYTSLPERPPPVTSG